MIETKEHASVLINRIKTELSRAESRKEVLNLLDGDGILLSPIYCKSSAEVNVVTISKRGEDYLSFETTQDLLRESIDFSEYILFIKEVESFLLLEDEGLIADRLKILNSNYLTISTQILELLFEIDGDMKILKAKVDFDTFMSQHRYAVIQMALSVLSPSILQNIPKESKKIYFLPFGDLEKIPFHVIPTGEREYLSDRYKISYIPSLKECTKEYTIDRNNGKEWMFFRFTD